jgi:uncharacterized damage-inducible protein DinB
MACLALSTAGLAAQGSSANPVTDDVRKAWDGAKHNVQASAELMTEANYGFKPVDSVRTFGEIVAHVAGANYVFCSAAKGEQSPHAEDEFEKSAKTKADIQKALEGSIVYCDGAYASVDDKTVAEVVDLPFDMGKGSRARMLLLNTGHNLEHYGNLVTYLRMKGLVPPSSRGQ